MSTQVLSPFNNTAASLSPLVNNVPPTISPISQIVAPSVSLPSGDVQVLPEKLSESLLPSSVKAPENEMKKMNMKMGLVIVLVLAIVTILIMGYLAKNYQCVQDTLNVSAWNSFPTAGAVLLFLSILISAYFMHKGFSSAQGYDKNLIVISYIAILILFIVAFTLFWRKGNYSGAFYVSLVIVGLSLMLTYFSWKSNKMSGYGQMPLFIMSVVLACYFYDITSKNHNNCGEINGISCDSSSTKDESCDS
jgi:tryptophan-rich sensory protein